MVIGEPGCSVGQHVYGVAYWTGPLATSRWVEACVHCGLIREIESK